jgi:hypothetical protein
MFESHQGFWILSCGEAIQLAYRMLVVLCPVLPEIMHIGASEIFLNQLSCKLAK